MKRVALILAAIISMGAFYGCSEEVSHSETGRQHILDNGQTSHEQTTYRNPDGTYTTEQTKTKTSN